MADKITFPAVIYKVQNVADGGYRFTLDSSDKIAAINLLALSDVPGVVMVTVEAQDDESSEKE